MYLQKKRVASGVLMQKFGPHQRPVAFYSVQLHLVAAGAPRQGKNSIFSIRASNYNLRAI